MQNVSFHEASVISASQLGDTLEIEFEGVTRADGTCGNVRVYFKGVKAITIDDLALSTFSMRFPDGEVIFMDLFDGEAHIGIEWNDFDSDVSEFHSYRIKFSSVELRS